MVEFEVGVDVDEVGRSSISQTVSTTTTNGDAVVETEGNSSVNPLEPRGAMVRVKISKTVVVGIAVRALFMPVG